MKKKEGDSFASFVRSALKRHKVYEYTRDNHIRPQIDFLSPGMEVFKLEDGLKTPILRACEKLQISPEFELRHDRKSKQSIPYKLKYNLKEKIFNLYRIDFELFGYNPNTVPDSIKLITDVDE